MTATPFIVTRAAADIGGTFHRRGPCSPRTGGLATRKLPSTPGELRGRGHRGRWESPSRSSRRRPARSRSCCTGCTVATNAILEGKGAPTALLTTRGFRDVLELRRVRGAGALRAPLRAPAAARAAPAPLRDRGSGRGRAARCSSLSTRRECGRRRSASGPPGSRRSRSATSTPSRIPPTNGGPARSSGRCSPVPSSPSRSTCSPRSSSTNAPPPPSSTPTSDLRSSATSARWSPRSKGPASAAGSWSCSRAAASSTRARWSRTPPASSSAAPPRGVIGAQHFAARAGFDNLITLDMGGTTAKASLIEGGRVLFADEYEVGGGMSSRSALMGGGGYALKLPVIDISEVGGGRRVDRVARQGGLAQGGAGERGPRCRDPRATTPGTTSRR